MKPIFDPILGRWRGRDKPVIEQVGGSGQAQQVIDYPVDSVNGQTDTVVLDIDDVAPNQAGNAGKYLKTDGTNATWQTATTTVITTDTKSTILNSTPTEDSIAFATDEQQFFVFTGGQWYEASIELAATEPEPDIGYTQDNDKRGYGLDYLDNKRATNFAMGLWSLPNPPEGAISIDGSTSPPTFYVYLNGQWNTLIYNFVVDTDYGLTHIPFLTYQLRVRNGDSVETGLNDQPMVKGYQMDVGAYPSRKRIIGSNLGA